MMKTLRPFLVAAAIALAAQAAVFAQLPPLPATHSPFDPQHLPFAWWKSDQFKKELGMSPEQCTRVDQIWQTARPELRLELDELQRLEDKFSRLIQLDAEEAALARQIDRVETARGNANKTRSLMLVQMLKVLTPDQRTRFNVLWTRWQQDLAKQPAPSVAPPSNRQPPRDSGKRPEE